MTTHTSQDRITILPDRLVDQIAAGEVIERPSSVVKELVENALDAGARQVTIEIAGAGEKEITVTDNGAGMTAGEIELAVQRHATSKIRTVDDLTSITSFGFRGEALPSIASVSRMEITSRRRGTEQGARRYFEGGKVGERETVGAAEGTRISVKNLFFNTPARKKFMKAESTEKKHIISTVTSFAVGAPRVAFTLVVDGKQVLRTPAAATMRDRLADLFGVQMTERLVPFAGGEGDIEIEGFAGKPEIARATRDHLYYFVNGRRIQSKSLHHALSAAYGELIPKGRFPFAVLFVDINPLWVDVNVHPTKREVRFRREQQLHNLVYYAVNRTIFSDHKSFGTFDGKMQVPKIDEQAGESATLPLQWDRTAWDQPPPEVSPRPTANASRAAEPLPPQSGDAPAPMPATENALGDVSGIEDLWQFHNLYILARAGEDLLIIDQHSAHERVLYEEILAKLEGAPPETQRLLFPESLDLEVIEYDTFEKNQGLLRNMGFSVREFGDQVVLLEGVPTGWKQKNPVKLFRWVLDDIIAAEKAGEDLKKSAAASYACRAAIMSGDPLTLPEMRALFRRLFACKNPYVCPHGRPTLVRVPMIEFDKKFCRRS